MGENKSRTISKEVFKPLDLHHFVRILMEACLVYRNIKNVTWGNMGAKEFLSHRDPHFLPGRKEESRGAIVGVINREARTNVCVGLGAQPKEELLLE